MKTRGKKDEGLTLGEHSLRVKNKAPKMKDDPSVEFWAFLAAPDDSFRVEITISRPQKASTCYRVIKIA